MGEGAEKAEGEGGASPTDVTNGANDVEEVGGVDAAEVDGENLEEIHGGKPEQAHGSLPEEADGGHGTLVADGVVVDVEQGAFAVSATELATSEAELAAS